MYSDTRGGGGAVHVPLDFELFRAHSEGLLPRGPKQNHYIPGLGTAVLYMLPLLHFADKRKNFVSGSQGSD